MRRIHTMLIAATLLVAGPSSQSFAGDAPCDGCAPKCGICSDKVCVTTSEMGTETRTCWEVECEEVCIPAVRFPWKFWKQKHKRCDNCCEQCPVPCNCGKVRCVRRLRQVEYDCDVCKYDHHIECRADCCESASCDVCMPGPSPQPSMTPESSSVEPISPPAEPTEIAPPPSTDASPGTRFSSMFPLRRLQFTR